jgi:hypothetical protein
VSLTYTSSTVQPRSESPSSRGLRSPGLQAEEAGTDDGDPLAL